MGLNNTNAWFPLSFLIINPCIVVKSHTALPDDNKENFINDNCPWLYGIIALVFKWTF